jgi:hypothetical protein
MKDFWGDQDANMTTTSLGKHFPVIEKKLGKNRELNGYVTYKDVQVIFGSFDTDLIVSYTVCFSLNLDNGDEIIYDELKMVTSAKVKAEDD